MSLRFVAVGDPNCGKTCLLNVFSQGTFPGCDIPTIINMYNTYYQIEGTTFELVLLDTGGLPGYDRLWSFFYPSNDAFLLCFALDDPDSFENIKERWIPELKHLYPNVPFILVGTKKDLRNQKYTYKNDIKKYNHIQTNDGCELAKEINVFSYIECSSMSSDGVNEVFESAIKATWPEKEIQRVNRRCAIL